MLQPPLAFLPALVRYCQSPSQITLAAALSMSAQPPSSINGGGEEGASMC